MHEAAAVLELWRAAEAVPSATDDVATVARLVETGEEPLLVAEVDGRVAGTLIAGWDGWRGNLYRLAVLPELRRRGVGLALVREAERRLLARGAVRISALVVAEDEAAAAFWAAAGYHHDTRIARFVRTAEGGPTAPAD